jgi:pilus assembly protein CpaC
MGEDLLRWLTAIAFVIGLGGMAAAQNQADTEPLVLIVGRSTVIRPPWSTVRVAVTDPTVAGVQVLTPRQVLVQGLSVGSTDLILWSEDEQQEPWQQRVTVVLDVEEFRVKLHELFPTASLEVTASRHLLIIKGVLRSTEEAEQLHRYLDKIIVKERDVSVTANVPGRQASPGSQASVSQEANSMLRGRMDYVDMTSVAGVQQVQLQVRVAEVSRTAIRSLGINGFDTGESFFFGQRVGSADGGAIVPAINIGAKSGWQLSQEETPFQGLRASGETAFTTPEGGIGASPLVTLFAGFPKADMEIFLQALAENQYLRLLANPTLVALSGEEASFLAGGEFPIPVPQSGGGGGNTTITVEYKEFGVRLTFRPIVLGDGGIRLYTSQEVSELTDIGSVTIESFSVPALITRRAEATLELKSGQSFAMAGLLQHTDTAVSSRIPGLGDLPVLGPLFRSVRYRDAETELVMLVTASLVEPLSEADVPPLPGVTHQTPDDWELYLEGRLEGREPAKLDPSSAQWLQEMGLDQLVGPGAWDSYEDKSMPAGGSMEPQETEPEDTASTDAQSPDDVE